MCHKLWPTSCQWQLCQLQLFCVVFCCSDTLGHGSLSSCGALSAAAVSTLRKHASVTASGDASSAALPGRLLNYCGRLFMPCLLHCRTLPTSCLLRRTSTRLRASRAPSAAPARSRCSTMPGPSPTRWTTSWTRTRTSWWPSTPACWGEQTWACWRSCLAALSRSPQRHPRTAR